MNSPVSKSIFNETGCVRKELLLRYRNNQLGNDEKHEVEEHLIDCPLCSDALEGLAMVTGTGVLNEIQQEIGKLTTATPSHTVRPWLAAATFAGILAIGYYAYVQYSGLKEERMANLHETKAPVQEELPSFQNQETIQSIAPAIADTPATALVMEAPMPELRKETSVQAPEAVTGDVAAEMVAEVDEPAVRTMEVAKASTSGAILINAPVPSNSAQNITYVDNVKVIDYTVYEPGNVKEADLPRSVSSKYQNEKAKREMTESEMKSGDVVNRKTDYINLVSDPIILFNNGRYESANAGFDRLLKMNSNDQNAAFYKGMSLYKLRQYDPALKLLQPISNDSASPFKEEAEFYTAKSLIGNGDTGKGKRILQEIVNKNGFYSQQATDELNRVNK